jgi:hypothetical protein
MDLVAQCPAKSRATDTEIGRLSARCDGKTAKTRWRGRREGCCSGVAGQCESVLMAVGAMVIA